MKTAFQRMKARYIRFVEKQGFPIIVTVCVGVITATALWTGRQEDAYVAPTPPPSGEVSAAQLLQQSLRDASTATPAPTATPRPWCAPVADAAVLRCFTTSTMVQSGVTDVWSAHPAVDLQAERGARVCAMADGTVIAAGEDQVLGVWLRIDHGDGLVALYTGMALAGAYLPGDTVVAGDTIGFVGAGPLDETDLGSHLHLAVTQDGVPVDPLPLWNAASP